MRRAAICLAFFCACVAGPVAPKKPARLLAGLLHLSETARLRLDKDVEPARQCIPLLAGLLAEIRPLVAAERGPRAMEILADFLFEQKGYTREVVDDDLQFMLLPWVLEHRRGSCLGLAGVFLVMARELGIEAQGVLVPGHFFLRSEGESGHVNFELLRRGERMPDEWYLEKWQVPQANPDYMRKLSDSEVLAVLRFNLANAFRKEKRWGAASDLYEQAIAGLEGMARAHANLGLIYQMLGELRRSERAYLRAAELHPGLEGLEENLRVLKLRAPPRQDEEQQHE